MGNLLRRIAGRHAALVAACLVLMAGFQLLMCLILSTLDIGAAFQQLVRTIPPFLQAMLGERVLGGLTERGFIAFGWNHPITIALGAALAITLAARAVAGEIENGALELVLAQPISRALYLGAYLLGGLGALALLSAAGALGTGLGQRVFGLEPSAAGALARLALAFFLLNAALFGITLAFSVLGRELGRVASAGVLVAVLMYMAQAVYSVWPRAAFLTHYTIYGYYGPRPILLQGVLDPGDVLALGLVILVTLGFAGWWFGRRDLP